MNKDLAYYEDAYIFGVESEVLSCVKGKKGYEIVLEDTAFYPEGGGQLCDIGTLNGFKVFDVREKDGKVVHYCEGEVEVGSLAKGEIDWNRRYDHMQNHT
ncbi:MAG: alanyl-tRNA editing protein, partial [Erysipelotrichaceae bacterium]|nr:alanyl-tRNA editing protein [Erysipelotrichaceae bacterium]